MPQEEMAESQSDSKYRKHNEQMFGFFYCAILMSIGISMSIYGTATAGSSEKILATQVYYIFIYLTSDIIIIALWTYLFIQRNKTHEALFKGENGTFQFVFSKKGEKVNMYLRFGVGMFGICTLCYLLLATYLRGQRTRNSASSIALGSCQALFVILQTLFILYFHRLVALVHVNLMKFAVLHLTITNMLMWANASIGKMSAEFESTAPCDKGKHKIMCLMCVYLLPTVSEYAVICGAVIHEIYLKIGKASLIELEKKEQKKTIFIKCSKSLPGVICGALLVIGCIVSAISSVVLHMQEKGEEWLYIFHSSQMILLNIMGTIFLIITFRKIREMKFSVSLSHSSLDKNILFVSFIMLINFLIISAIICGREAALPSNSRFGSDLKLRFASAIFEIIQTCLQTHFITECLQRCSFNNKQKETKPGRNCIAILLGINFGMWFLWTLQIKNADIIYHKKGGSYTFITNGNASAFQTLLLFFLQTTLPMGMLYRYHSSACLSDIYTKIYQTEPERFVDHLRSGKLQNDPGILSKDGKHKSVTCKKSNLVSFSNIGFDSDRDSTNSGELPYKKRSQSIGIVPSSILKTVSKKMIRRATLKNMEEAQYKFESEIISHKMLHRKMSPDAAFPFPVKEEKDPKVLYPSVNKMIREGLFAMSLDYLSNDDDNDSVYSI